MSGPDFSLYQYFIKFLFTNSNSLFPLCLNPTGFLSFHCKEIEENNRKGKRRDVSKKIRNTKGTFHVKIGTVKDRKRWTLQKQKILRRGGKNTQKNCTKKGLHDPDNHDDWITHTHLEPDILECEVKWALGSITMT